MAGHSHLGDESAALPRRTAKALQLTAVVLAVATVIGMFVLRPSGESGVDLEAVGVTGEFYDAKVTEITELECPGLPENERPLLCARVVFELLAGPDEGEVVSQELFDLSSTVPLSAGDKVVLRRDPRAEEGFAYQFSGDRQRKPVLFWLAVLFAVAVVALGRLRGLAALAGLVASLAVLLGFILPAIIDGRSPVVVAVLGSAAIAYLALYLAHGFNSMTTVALLGTLASLAVTLVLGVIFVDLAAFSGFSTEDAFYLQVGGADIDFKGLILAGIVIGALGAIDDMTVTQASSVWELHRANPELGRFGLYRAAMQIGRDHVASTVNTLVLAYAGASLPLLLLFVLSTQSLGTVANSEVVAVELVRTLVGSIGLVVAVPITTWLAALVVPHDDPTETSDRRRERRRQRWHDEGEHP